MSSHCYYCKEKTNCGILFYVYHYKHHSELSTKLEDKSGQATVGIRFVLLQPAFKIVQNLYTVFEK